jgi:hypothetical protein
LRCTRGSSLPTGANGSRGRPAARAAAVRENRKTGGGQILAHRDNGCRSAFFKPARRRALREKRTVSGLGGRKHNRLGEFLVRFGSSISDGHPAAERRRARDVAPNVPRITMAAMAARGVRSGSLPFARRTRSRRKREVSANPCARARTLALPCHAEGRGFESLHPLLNPLQTGRCCRLDSQPCNPRGKVEG